jgi:hypothetical protein
VACVVPVCAPPPRDLGAEPSPFVGLQKSAVLQECRVFHDSEFVRMHPKRCCQKVCARVCACVRVHLRTCGFASIERLFATQITKLLALLTRGETFTGAEATEVCARAAVRPPHTRRVRSGFVPPRTHLRCRCARFCGCPFARARRP